MTEQFAQEPITMSVAQVADRGSAVLDEVATLVVGMKEPLKIALAAVLGGGHVLFEDVPGLGKTLAARSLATALGLSFRRVQCTPDLLPSDITGSSVLPSPGTSSNSTCPPPRTAASATFNGSRMPTTSVATSSSACVSR